ncbi:MAG: glycogen debranching protein GlgX [Rhizobiaceae bacterium]
MSDADAPLGAIVEDGGVRFGVFAPDAITVSVCLFDAADRQLSATPLAAAGDGYWSARIAGIGAGQRYGFRADGAYDPENGNWFDPAKLLADPHAARLDRPFQSHEALAVPRDGAIDTAPLMPKCVVEETALPAGPPPPTFRPGGLIYEINVRALTMRHPAIAEADRGTLSALAHPAIIEHLKKIGATAVELMPVTAWIDEPHLARRGLVNGWGYNPVTFMALDPRLAPGGIGDLAHVASALRQAGIGVLLDLVFNHTGEGDADGPTLSLRGLANRAAYRHDAAGRLVNDTGTGNTVACDNAYVMRLIVDSLRHFVLAGGVDGFRFDLAPVLGRSSAGFSPDAPLIRVLRDDPVIGSRILIAEPWDIGPDGYQLGRFPSPFLEWNDRYRDDVRRFWRGDAGTLGALATRLAGSSDIFGRDDEPATRAVNFIAAHDGFTLADLVSYRRKHNEPNGEDNRDGHNENFSWNGGHEGETGDRKVTTARRADVKALLATLFASRGTIMLTAGDEFGRTQQGNNNAYCQDNELTWLDWENRDTELEAHVAALARLRERFAALGDVSFLTGTADDAHGFADVEWLDLQGAALTPETWNGSDADHLTKLVHSGEPTTPLIAFLVNRAHRTAAFRLPARAGYRWSGDGVATDGRVSVSARSVATAILERSPSANAK